MAIGNYRDLFIQELMLILPHNYSGTSRISEAKRVYRFWMASDSAYMDITDDPKKDARTAFKYGY